MTPLTCRVVDVQSKGIPGVPIMLEQLDDHYQSVASYESMTDQDGGVAFWFPFPAVRDGVVLEPIMLDASSTTHVTLRFLPWEIKDCPEAPWLSVCTDLFLSTDFDHGVTLHLEASPRLEHTIFPVAGPREAPLPQGANPLLVSSQSSITVALHQPMTAPKSKVKTKAKKRIAESSQSHVVTRAQKKQRSLE
ncbi:hypothetical protein AAL_08010 [Moelleriella libera RCEF 2490]|uniref:Uncharacterized protein n=1 Tax=Moelleriella libera RCEF 2490 TaxID=1081109 RepID=A0A167WG87_9HYPO|nr:hypothetical protein AAL_08010 [Moelleriella libera RCEF 2490]